MGNESEKTAEKWVYLDLDYTDNFHVVRDAETQEDVAHVPFSRRRYATFERAVLRARLIAAAPETAAERDRLKAEVERLEGRVSGLMRMFEGATETGEAQRKEIEVYMNRLAESRAANAALLRLCVRERTHPECPPAIRFTVTLPGSWDYGYPSREAAEAAIRAHIESSK